VGTLRFDMMNRSDALMKVVFAAMDHLTNEMVSEDTGCMLAWLDAQGRVKPGAVGCVGHCMSGRYITTVAAHYPSRIKAAASLYGVGIVTDKEDSPHLLLDQVQGELYYGFAERDQHVPDHVIPALRDALKVAGTKSLVEEFAGTDRRCLMRGAIVRRQVPEHSIISRSLRAPKSSWAVKYQNSLVRY
jgi:carboxymethylenebutenolidase